MTPYICVGFCVVLHLAGYIDGSVASANVTDVPEIVNYTTVPEVVNATTIAEVSCEVNTNLNEVSCKSQGLTEVPQEGIPETTLKLDLSNNNLETLQNRSFIRLPNLTTLILNSNNMATIESDAFLGLTKLQTLNLQNDRLSQWPDFSSACSSLESLQLSDNELGSADNRITCLQSLKTLRLSGNKYTTFPNLTDVGHTLKYLYLYYNEISNVKERDLLPLKVILYIGLTSNRIQSCAVFAVLNTPGLIVDLNGNILTDVEGCISVANRYGLLEMSHNHLTHIPPFGPDCSRLTRLSFSICRISTIDEHAFDNCQKVTNLAVDSNRLTEFPVLYGMRKTLNFLYLANNRITHLAPARLDQLRQLRKLSLSNNKLSSFPDVPGPSLTLKHLDLSKNPFTAFPKLDIIGPNITTLILSDNTGLTVFVDKDISGLLSLESLLLKGTSITAMPGLISKPSSLTELDLGGSPVSRVSAESMMYLATSQLALGLADTAITKLPSTCGPVTGSLDLTGNTIDMCSCDMLWLKMLNGAGVTTDSTPSCSGLDWEQATYQQLYEVCPKPPAVTGYKETRVQRVGIVTGCSLPLAGNVHDSVTRSRCLAMCVEQVGCLGFNFRSTASHGGQCVLVAPDSHSAVDDTLPDDPDKGEWRFYAVDI